MKRRELRTKQEIKQDEKLEKLVQKIYKKRLTGLNLKAKNFLQALQLECEEAGFTINDLIDFDPQVQTLLSSDPEIKALLYPDLQKLALLEETTQGKIDYRNRDKILKRIIKEGYFYTEFPEQLSTLSKEQVQDLIQYLCTEGANRGWFTIMDSTPNVTSVGFDCIFSKKLMFGSEDKVYQNNMQFFHPLTNLLKEYINVYKLDEWYEKNRLYWYQELLLRSGQGIKKFTQENKLICLLTEIYELPIICKDKELISWERMEEDIYFNGLIAWYTGTHDIYNYGNKGRNYGKIKEGKERDLFRNDITGNKDILENRKQQFKKIKDNLREKGYRFGRKEEELFVPLKKLTVSQRKEIEQRNTNFYE